MIQHRANTSSFTTPIQSIITRSNTIITNSPTIITTIPPTISVESKQQYQSCQRSQWHYQSLWHIQSNWTETETQTEINSYSTGDTAPKRKCIHQWEEFDKPDYVTKGCLKGKKCDECNVKFMGGPKIVGEGAVGLYWPSRKMTANCCTICGVIVCYPCRVELERRTPPRRRRGTRRVGNGYMCLYAFFCSQSDKMWLGLFVDVVFRWLFISTFY